MSSAAVGDTAPTFVRRPVFGADIDTESICRDQALALVFLRHPGSAVTRHVALSLHQIWPDLDVADVALVAVIEGDLAAIRDFVPRYHIKYPVVADDGGLYESFGVPRDGMLRKTLLSLRPDSIRGYVECLQAGRGLIHGPYDRLMSAVVVAPGGQVAWRWDASSLFERLDVDEFRAQALAAGERRGAA